MSYEHFGNFLRELRESRNLTREQLAQNICTPKQIYRIEKGEYEPSLYLLNQLSIKFNLDLNEYFKMYFSSNTIVGFEGIKQINSAIEHNDIKSLKSLIENYEKLEDFKHGENLQHILYGKALCSAIMDGDYKLSLIYCMKGILIENPCFSIDKIRESTYSNVGFSLIHCISCNYLSMNQTKTGIQILYELLYVLENYILNSPYSMYQASQFSKKIYQNTLYNMSLHLLKSGDVKNAHYYVNKGIDFSLKEYNLRFLPELIYMKFKLLYYEQEYEEAKKYYNRIISLYEITNQEVKVKEFKEAAPSEFPEIFKHN